MGGGPADLVGSGVLSFSVLYCLRTLAVIRERVCVLLLLLPSTKLLLCTKLLS